MEDATIELRGHLDLAGQSMRCDRYAQAINELQLIFAGRRQACQSGFVDPGQAGSTGGIAPAVAVDTMNQIPFGHQHEGGANLGSDFVLFPDVSM